MFNQTFSLDKPIIFPSTWGTGKTQLELYEQWKSTLQFFFIKYGLEIGAASLLFFLIASLLIALKQLYRISQLDDLSIEKKQHKKYLNISFIAPLVFIEFLCLCILVLCLFQEWTRVILLKGLAFCLLSYTVVKMFKKVKPIFRRFKLKLAKLLTKNKKANHSQ